MHLLANVFECTTIEDHKRNESAEKIGKWKNEEYLYPTQSHFFICTSVLWVMKLYNPVGCKQMCGGKRSFPVDGNITVP